MGLLDKLENKIAKHPLADETYETKINYLNAIGFFIAIDDKITEYEIDSFNKIIELLDCEEAKDDLYDFMENPDLDEFENTFKFMNEKAQFTTYLLEVLFFSDSYKFNEKEMKFIDLVIERNNSIDNSIYNFINTIQKNDDFTKAFSYLLEQEGLFKTAKEVFDFYSINDDLRQKLSNEIKLKKQPYEDEISELSSKVSNKYTQQRNALAKHSKKSFKFMKETMKLTKEMINGTSSFFSNPKKEQEQLQEEMDRLDEENNIFNERINGEIEELEKQTDDINKILNKLPKI